MSLADDIIEQNNKVELEKYEEFGIDELGLAVPKPVNADYILSRIIARHEFFFKIGKDVFIDRKKITSGVSNLTLAITILCGDPKIVLWADNIKKEDWKGVMPTIKRDSSLIYSKMLALFPEYNRDFIKITDGLIWNKKKADIEQKQDNKK